MSVLNDISVYSNWVISIAGFLYWSWQLGRSWYLYTKLDGDHGRSIFMIHFMLFAANILYLLYELNFNWTPIYFTMLMFTDITGIWCFNLVN
jgi:hypothetical protein